MSRITQIHSDFFAKSIHYPASTEFITNLNSFKVTDEIIQTHSLQCAICSGYFVVNEDASALECNHMFHTICIKAWLSKVNILFCYKFKYMVKRLITNNDYN